MKVIAVTGGIGSGKTMVCNFFAKCGAKVISADDIARKFLKKDTQVFCKIIELFGADILNSVGEINKKKLSKIVFSDKDMLKALNLMTHEYILDEMKRILKNSRMHEIVVLEIPLLFQVQLPFEIDASLALLCDTEIRVRRVMKRSNLERQEVLNIIKNQVPQHVYLQNADFVIENDGEFEEIKESLYGIYQKVLFG